MGLSVCSARLTRQARCWADIAPLFLRPTRSRSHSSGYLHSMAVCALQRYCVLHQDDLVACTPGEDLADH